MLIQIAWLKVSGVIEVGQRRVRELGDELLVRLLLGLEGRSP